MGTIWTSSNQIERDNNDIRATGAKAYFYDSGTTTPKSVYQNGAETVAWTQPVLADGNGRWPGVFVPFGDFKVVVTTSGGTTLYTMDDIPNPAPTDPAAGVDANSILQTGDMVFQFKQGTRDGCVRANGRTMGSAASGATERANADTSNLYTYLWNNFSDTICPVATGRGASAAADFAANKAITLLDLRGAVPAGLADMGSTDAGHYNPAIIPAIVGNATTGGSTVGANSHGLTLAQSAAHTHSVSITSGVGTAHTHGTGSIGTSNPGDHSHTINITDPGHGHTLNNATAVYRFVAGANTFTGPGINANTNDITVVSNTTGITASSVATGGHTHTLTGALDNESAHTHSVSGNTGSQGSNDHHNNMCRAVIGTWYIKL